MSALLLLLSFDCFPLSSQVLNFLIKLFFDYSFAQTGETGRGLGEREPGREGPASPSGLLLWLAHIVNSSLRKALLPRHLFPLLGHLHLSVSESKLVTLSGKKLMLHPWPPYSHQGCCLQILGCKGPEIQRDQMWSNSNLWPRVMNLP